MTISGTLTVNIVRDKQIPQTPLEKLIGFQFSEDIYDHLLLIDQVILDMLLLEYQQNEVAQLMNVHKSYISRRMREIRAYIANTELERHLRLRAEMKNGEHLK